MKCAICHHEDAHVCVEYGNWVHEFCLKRAVVALWKEREEREAEAMAWDRLVYGNSFELDGKRVDPRHVLLREDGTYVIKEKEDAE
jgi:hypothetical protein